MKRIRRLVVWAAFRLLGRHPTDAEIVARARHPERRAVDLDDVGLAMYMRWGRFCDDLQAMPPLWDLGPVWHDIAVKSLRDNDLPTDPETVLSMLEIWHMAAIIDDLDSDIRTSLGILGHRKLKRTPKFVH